MSDLFRKFEQYGGWRGEVLTALAAYRDHVEAVQLMDPDSQQRIEQMAVRLSTDKLTVAFVAEFSRGKSELINAIFFAGYGQRILPSSAGRTTMCPTELLYDETFPPSIRLLPIETRAHGKSTADLKSEQQVWTVLPLNLSSGDGMQDAFRQVSLTKRVTVAQAHSYGLYDENDPDRALAADADGLVEVSRWRHAIVNFPHPLLQQGLVIIDTPGLNAIGTEPELTLNLIPNAHAVLFILAADTGVTKSDITIWRDHIGAGAGRMVVLNKIDSMWDELRSADEVEQQICQQVSSAAQLLGLQENQIFPVSAQKGLVGKINHDLPLLIRSRMPTLENALSEQLIPARQHIIRSQLDGNIDELTAAKRAQLLTRTRNVVEQLLELKSLRGKNQNIIDHMMKRIDIEKREFDKSLIKLQGTRAVFARLSNDVFTSLGMDILKQDIRLTRQAMEGSIFSSGFREAVRRFFEQVQNNLYLSSMKTDEISAMMTVMYRKFSTEHGLALSTPMPFSLDKYVKEIRMIEVIYQRQFGTAAIVTTRTAVLMQKFFDSIASRVKQSFLQANRDVDAWLKVVMAPLEGQIREHKAQLKRRRQSIERIHLATDSLEEKVTAFEQMEAELSTDYARLMLLESSLRTAVQAELVALEMAS
ncbi:dynamin family protein [Actimicrobium sp. CCI2.3]|uniref:dynamin family protein n=1 Tax=Actimicrobium sp. CCI2.3 TaxID=3048616 RepID=UPI002AB4C9B6|nr:dynamin family protein [Actimicrobium sp. CCI2.3]MDY7576275.1 dynamin family protein [Actimicrobium sp. CCI2.3]MEB0020522.1 dynamin family protein [Actimicrobium sp. CCI2.3]